MRKNLNLGIFLSLGDGFEALSKSGQDKRFIKEYLERYNKAFKKVYVFSYTRETKQLPKKCSLLSNKNSTHRFLYQFLIPFIYWQEIKRIDVFRVMQLTGVVPAIICRLLFRKPFVFTYGYDYSSFARLEKKRIIFLLKILEKIAVKLASGIIVTNKRIKAKLKQKYPQAKLFYIPNGVDLEKFKLRIREMSLKQNKAVKFLFVGRLVKQKNLENLIKAVALMAKDYKAKLVFIGQGELGTQLLKMARENGVDLKIIDKVENSKLPSYYQKADIFCLPSFLEGQPKVLLEAMASGLPCLVGKYRGVNEFKNKKEVLLTGFKPKEIAANLLVLIKNYKLREKLSLNSREKVEREFDIRNLLIKEIKILENV